MEPETGAIRAMASFPAFDPNFFLNSITPEQWQEQMTTHNPLLNRICSAEYPPASVFKVVTFAAGLEEGIVDSQTNVSCKGYVHFHGRNYYCIKHSGHGRLSLKDAFAKSCNIQCFEIAKKIKIDTLADYACRFGLGQKTNFLLPEKSGLVPTSLWKKAIKQEPWWKGETLSASIGQSYLLATPLQIARLTSAIFTGYLVKPRILEIEPIEREKLLIAETTRAFLQNAMKEAVNSGTGWRLRYFKNVDLYVKTGTAQTCALNREKTSRRQLEHAWLIGHFSYKGSKPLSLVVLIENMGSSAPAIMATKKFIEGYQRLMESAPV
jgi:penicillin-binding protein 2